MKQELTLYVSEDTYWRLVIKAAKTKQSVEDYCINVLETLAEEYETDD